MSKDASSTLEESHGGNSPRFNVSLTALAIAILETLLTITLIGLLAVSGFGTSELLESTLWLITPIISVILGVSRYPIYLRWEGALKRHELTICISYLGLGSTVFVLRFYFPQSLSVTLLIAALLIAIIVLQTSSRIVNRKHALRTAAKGPRSVVQIVLLSLLGILGIFLTLAAFWPNTFAIDRAGRAFVFACCGVVLATVVAKIKVSLAKTLIVRVLLVAIAALAVWDFSRDLDIHHLGFFLAPANEVQHGRLMLVDTFSQYGVGMFYFLVALLKLLGFGYGSITLLTACLTALMTVLIFSVLVYATRSTTYSTLGTYTAAILGPLASLGSVATYPSTGFLRFGPTWLLILVLTITLKREFPSRVWITLASGVLAISCIWSLESAFYSLGTFVTVGVLGPIVIGEKALARQFIRSAIVSITVVGLVGTLLTVIFGGESINITTYLMYLKLYSLDGLGALPIEPWSPGILMFLVAIGSLTTLAIVFASRSFKPATIRRDLFPILAVTTYAILAFTYYLGRSHPNNLTHVSAPFVVMITMWLFYLVDGIRFSNKLVFSILVGSSFFAVAITGLANWPNLKNKLPNSALASLSPTTTSGFLDRAAWFLSNPVIDSRSETIESLLDENLPRETPVLVVVDANLMTETLVRLGRVNLITLSNPEGESLLQSEVRRITAQISAIPCESYVLLQQSEFRKNDAQEMLFLILAHVKVQFDLLLVDEYDEFGLYTAKCI